MGIQKVLRSAAPVVAAAVAAVPLSAGPASADPPARHCIFNITNGSERCFSSFRDSIAYATAGRVSDAPDSPAGAAASTSFAAEVDAAGAAAGKSGGAAPVPGAVGAKAAASNQILVMMLYTGQDHDGDSAGWVADGPCTANSSQRPTWSWHDLSRFAKGSGGTWGDAANSYIGYNQCDIKPFSGVNWTGYQGDAAPQGYTGTGALRNHIESVQLYYRPSDQETLGLCSAGNATCSYTPASDTYGSLDQTKVATAANCSGLQQSETLSWSHQFTTTDTVGATVGVTVGFDIAEKFEVSVQASYSHAWAQTASFSQTTPINVPAGEIGTLWIAPVTETVTGHFAEQLGYQYYGSSHYWPSFASTRVVEEQAPAVVWKSRAMTADERQSICAGAPGLSVHRDATTTQAGS
ncbi:hypothetical protein [Kitasatospora mediocidica]|uniref:hypothetical protein n=1 Tax=Kitasatospora mediocidica TaxID=58352 RepID=UPI000691868B|nr:hypothetical protein [Kitasatospora mediocidica]